MPVRSIHDPEYWRKCAEESRALANEMRDEIAKNTMLRIAASHDFLAAQAEGSRKRDCKRSIALKSRP
jgi:hypothetical protein